MKKIVSILLSLIMAISFVGCASSAEKVFIGTWNSVAGGELTLKSSGSVVWNMYELDGLDRGPLKSTYKGSWSLDEGSDYHATIYLDDGETFGCTVTGEGTDANLNLDGLGSFGKW